jgi:hypothetical protein
LTDKCYSNMRHNTDQSFKCIMTLVVRV